VEREEASANNLKAGEGADEVLPQTLLKWLGSFIVSSELFFVRFGYLRLAIFNHNQPLGRKT
jgi:hypothetical protein